MMVPTLNYYLPIINKLKFILDNDLNKKNKFFLNMNPKIKHFNGNFESLKKYKNINYFYKHRKYFKGNM